MSETEILREKYGKILISNGIHDKISKVTMQDSGAKGDGMASLTKGVTVTFENGAKAPLNFFVKLHTGNPSHEAMLEDLKAFEKEARFFMEYLPAAKKLCESKGLKDLIDFYPKCFHANEHEIVLENVAIERGYEMMPQDKRHDFNTAVIALTTLAKHHAISFAMIHDSGGKKKFFDRFPNLDHDGMLTPSIVELMTTSVETSLQTNITIFEKNKTSDGDKILEKLKSLLGTSSEMISALKNDGNENKPCVLNHGDYKNNNMMVLKDKETSKIIHHIAIDLQVTRYNSPALDICFYLCSSVDPTVRQSRLEELLNIYLETLNTVSTNLGYSIDLSFEDLLMQYRRKFKYGFFIATTLVGPGMALLKMADIDVTKIAMTDFVKVVHNCLLKWINDNPEKGKTMANEIRNLVEEYNKLAL